MTWDSTAAADRPTARRSHSHGDSYDNIEPWFEKLRALPDGDEHHDALRGQVIELCLPLADHIARKFNGRGEQFDDLEQTARVGLVLAVDRYDVTRGSSFLSFAIPTIMGEVRRHFRDRTWRSACRVGSRRSSSGSDPPPRNCRSDSAGCPMRANSPTNSTSTWSRSPHAGRGQRLSDQLDRRCHPRRSRQFLAADHRHPRLGGAVLSTHRGRDGGAPADRRAPRRGAAGADHAVLRGQTQGQIAEELGVSQMQVSRILSRTLALLREQALAEPTPTR